MTTPLRLAFMGFRHGHIFGLHKQAQKTPGVQIVGACEEDSARAAELRSAEVVELTHDSLSELLQSGCDAVAIGDYFSRRGSVIIECLRAGKHVIADKPICTDLGELETIEQLASASGLSVGCQLDLRGSGALRAMRRLIGEGAIGTVHTVNFTAQHPLLLSSRPAWYFEPGKQGGTINDIAVHGLDAIPWITGRRAVEVVAARQWNARLPQFPHFGDAAQFMLRLDNGGGLLADVSYLAPDACGYTAPQYWRITCHGDGGVIEAQASAWTLTLARSDDKAVQTLPADPSDDAVTLSSFMNEIAGRPAEGQLTSRDVLTASRKALLVQRAADRHETGVRI